MSTTHKLNAETRTVIGTGKLNSLRRSGLIPGVVYGPGSDNINVQVNAREFSKMLSAATSEHFLVDLQIDGKSCLALLQDVQHDSLTGQNVHVDFFAVRDDTEIHSVVPVVLVGEAVGAAQGGVVDQTLHELHIKCQVKDLPETIEVDVTNLGLGSAIRLADVKLPEGVTATIHEDTPVAVVEAPAAAEEETAEAAEGEAPAAE